MTRLWDSLIKDPQAAIADNIGAILRELCKTASSADNWREREAACSALTDVLAHGRTAGDVTPILEDLWRAVLRSIDDIKDSVRDAALDTLKVGVRAYMSVIG